MDLNLLVTLSLILLFAVIGGLVSFKYKQPSFVGYIIAGLFLGSLIPFIYKTESNLLVQITSEVSLALLLFTVGIEFSLERIKKIGNSGVIGAVLQVAITLFIVTLILFLFFKINLVIALFIGGVVSLSSIAIVSKMLSERGDIDSSHGELSISWLIAQNLVAIPLILFLPLLSNIAELSIFTIFINIVKTIVLIYSTFLLSRKTIPYIFKRLALYDNRELLLVSAFLICIGFATLAYLLGLSLTVGAFLAGLLISSSAVNHEVFTEIRPLRNIFSGVFFVSLGFLLSLNVFIGSIFVALGLSFLVISVKFIVVLFIVLILNYHSKIAFLTAIALFQIGELGFILAKVGFDLNILDLKTYQIILSTTVLTMLITPVFLNNSIYIYKVFQKFVKNYIPGIYNYIFNVLDSDAKMPRPRKIKIQNHIILVGYGKVGKYIGRIFELTGIQYVVIDIHYRTVFDLRKKGVNSIYGDAINADILILAGLETAKGIIITTPDIVANELILTNVRRINPGIKVVVRAHKPEDIARLAIRGVKDIIEPEFEAGLQIARRILSYFEKSSKDINDLLKQSRKERKF